MKTASRILGSAFFLEGYEVQDAPRYGAERRGAPIFAYVRAARRAINERGIIALPDVVVVADETLVPIPAAGVLLGLTERAVVLINTAEPTEAWKGRLNVAASVIALPTGEDVSELGYIGGACAGAAARLVGVVKRESLEQAIRDELGSLADEVIAKNLENALRAYDALQPHAGKVTEGEEVSASTWEAPDWIDLPFEDARVSAPDIYAPATSEKIRTGLWRTARPVVDYELCHRCAWVCGTLCPDGVIGVDPQGAPQIDYDHCKGCLVCAAVCPRHAIRVVPEHPAEAAGGET